MALGLSEIWVAPSLSLQGQSGPEVFPGSPVLHTAFLMVCALPLAWRHRAPVTVLAIVIAAVVTWTYAMYGFTGLTPFEAFFAPLVAFYAAGSQTADRRPAAAVACLLIIVLTDLPRLIAGIGGGDVIPAWLFYAFALLGGRIIRQRRTLADTAESRAARLGRERRERDHAAVAEERARIARELHDIVAHSLSVVVLQAGIQRHARQHAAKPEGLPTTPEALASIEKVSREALVELRLLLGILRDDDADTDLEPQPDLQALDDLLAHVRQTGLAIDVQIVGEPAPLPPGVELTADRIVQEALTNTVRHAHARRADVLVTYSDHGLELEVADDGLGIANSVSGGGHGFVGMRERVALYGGTVEIGTRSGGGAVIRARLPIDYSGIC